MVRKPRPTAIDAVDDGAPMIVFDDAAAISTYGDMVGITLTVDRPLPTAEGHIAHRPVVAAYLRMNVAAAESLFAALQKAAVMMVPSPANRC